MHIQSSSDKTCIEGQFGMKMGVTEEHLVGAVPMPAIMLVRIVVNRSSDDLPGRSIFDEIAV